MTTPLQQLTHNNTYTHTLTHTPTLTHQPGDMQKIVNTLREEMKDKDAELSVLKMKSAAAVSLFSAQVCRVHDFYVGYIFSAYSHILLGIVFIGVWRYYAVCTYSRILYSIYRVRESYVLTSYILYVGCEYWLCIFAPYIWKIGCENIYATQRLTSYILEMILWHPIFSPTRVLPCVVTSDILYSGDDTLTSYLLLNVLRCTYLLTSYTFSIARRMCCSVSWRLTPYILEMILWHPIFAWHKSFWHPMFRTRAGGCIAHIFWYPILHSCVEDIFWRPIFASHIYSNLLYFILYFCVAQIFWHAIHAMHKTFWGLMF